MTKPCQSTQASALHPSKHLQTTPDGIFTFCIGRLVFPLTMMKGGNSFHAAEQHNTAVMRFFSELVVYT